MRLHYLQHVPFEGLGKIEEWAVKAKHPISSTRLHANEPLPAVDSFDHSGRDGRTDGRRTMMSATVG